MIWIQCDSDIDDFEIFPIFYTKWNHDRLSTSGKSWKKELEKDYSILIFRHKINTSCMSALAISQLENATA
jgi:hypothetical protein